MVVAILASAYFIYYALTYKEWHFLDNINLIIHEAGHVVFLPFGMFLHILGGSLFQVLAPIVFVIYFYRLKDYFSASLLLFWVGQNLLNVSVYASDAIDMNLPLLGGDSVMHDWNTLLQMINALKYTSVIGGAIYFAGIITIVAAVCASLSTSFLQSEEI